MEENKKPVEKKPVKPVAKKKVAAKKVKDNTQVVLARGFLLTGILGALAYVGLDLLQVVVAPELYLSTALVLIGLLSFRKVK
jgi:hypothetical protein